MLVDVFFYSSWEQRMEHVAFPEKHMVNQERSLAFEVRKLMQVVNIAIWFLQSLNIYICM